MQITRYSFRILMKFGFSREIFKKYSEIRFHENEFTGSQVLSCGRTDRRKDMSKLIVAFGNFVKAPKM